MRRTTMLLAVVVAVLLLASGTALALNNIRCDGGTCQGTNQKDKMVGSAKHDTMYGKKRSDVMLGGGAGDTMYGGYGGDEIEGGPGPDTIDGDAGNDTIYADDGEVDSISCGLGDDDTAYVDAADLEESSIEEFVRLTSCENVEPPVSSSV